MAAAPAEPDAAPLYAFEEIHGRAGSHRDPRQAREQLAVLWERLGGDPAQLPALERDDPDGWRFLLRYIVDGPLNIQWYDGKRPELEAKQRRYNTLMLALALVLVAIAIALPFQPLLLVLIEPQLELADTASSTGLIDVAALLGVTGTGGAVALRMSAQVVRYRRQAAVFHKASAALKEQLYQLEGDWAQPPLLDPDAPGDKAQLHPEFAAAIRQAVGRAQSIVSQERDAFFDTLTVDVNALTDNAVKAAHTLETQAAFRSDRRHEDAKARRELERQRSQARLAESTARAKLAVLEAEQAEAEPSQQSELVMLIRDQRLALHAAQQQVSHLQAELDASTPG